MPSQTLGKCNSKFSTKFSKNWNFQNFSKMLKFSLKTHSLKALGFRKSFFGRSCALEINKWCEALSPDGQNREIWDPGIKLWRPLILASVLNFRKILLLKFWIVQRPKIRVQCELHRNVINGSGTYSAPDVAEGAGASRISNACRANHSR